MNRSKVLGGPGSIHPGLAMFRELATDHAMVPVELKVLGDALTPMTMYQAIRRRSRYSVLLESVQGGEASSRYSFLGFGPSEVFGSMGRRPFMSVGEDPVSRTPEAPFDTLARIGAPGRSPVVPGLPPFVGGAVGYVGYDAVPLVEDLAFRPKPGLAIPEVFFLTFSRVIAFDHRRQTLSLIVNAPVAGRSGPDLDRTYREAIVELEELAAIVTDVSPLPVLPLPARSTDLPADLPSAFGKASFEAAVDRVKDYILAGDIFQGVLSRRIALPARDMDPFELYRVLRFLNPSPYMFLLDFGSFQVVGASPEALVRLTGETVEVRPIAGTRRRGETDEEDRRLERELVADPKERAEHLMLVDLGRNDVGRVSTYGSVGVSELMEVERYSHVMHLVSRVVGTRRPGLTAVDVFRHAFPAGTVTGAPKIRAMQIIDELEPEARGLYAGGIGYFSFDGQMDSCIAIRTLLLHEGRASIQAGAGIVADSRPELEYLETLNKAQSSIQAIRFLETRRGTPG